MISDNFKTGNQDFTGKEKIMTIKEYNTVLHPKIGWARVFINGIDHAAQKTDNPKETQRQLACIGWSDECKETILEALDCYQSFMLETVKRKEGETD